MSSVKRHKVDSFRLLYLVARHLERFLIFLRIILHSIKVERGAIQVVDINALRHILQG